MCGRHVVLSRERLATILDCNNQDRAIDLQKGFVTLNRRWDPSHDMTRFGLDYQPFRSSRKETMLASIFESRHHLIIYMMAHNIIPKKTGHTKSAKITSTFSTTCFIIGTPPTLEFPCQTSLLAISDLRRGGGRIRSNCPFLVCYCWCSHFLRLICKVLGRNML